MTVRMTVFDVERGLCVYVRSPTGYSMLIDCGRSSDFSPAQWIADNEAASLTKWNNYTLTKLVVTHPHDDHVEDIDSVKAKLEPGLLKKVDDFNWTEIVNPADGDPSENVVTYYEWQKKYTWKEYTAPNWGMGIEHFFVPPNKAKAISASNQNLVNNSSIVTVLTYAVPKGTWRVVIGGDNEAVGWAELLKDSAFQSAIKGAHFFVTSHHGHESGFSADLMAAMGKPIFNITSERAGDESVHDYRPYALGATIKNEERYHLTTRHDGHITLSMDENFMWNCRVTR